MPSTLIHLRWPSNTGYAIEALERVFFDTALELARGDASRVHVAYHDLSGGPPRSLPGDFTNYLAISLADSSNENLQRIGEIVRDRRIDLVLAFDARVIQPAFRVMRRNGVRAIVAYWGAPISSFMPSWKLALKRIQVALSSSRADGLVFESQAMADLAVYGRGVPRSMIDVVPLGVDVDRFRPAVSDYIYRALDLPRTRKVFVFSGHCTPRKGIATLIDAAVEVLKNRRRSDAAFVICGDQGDESRPFRARYAGLGLDEWIRFTGYRSDLLQIFQSAFCGVIPSSGWDSFTLSSVEMAATGLPIIASDLQGLREAVLDRVTGLLFEPGNPRALADRVELLLHDPGLAAQLGRQGRARVERELTVDLQRGRLLAALRRHYDGKRPLQPATAATGRD